MTKKNRKNKSPIFDLRIVFLLTILSLFYCVNVFATTYYISQNGNDSAGGTAPETPWKTIAKINASSFQPGDEILFKRGDVWAEQLNISSSGKNDSPILFGAYGEGNKPTIDVNGKATHAIISYASYITIQELVLQNSINNALGIAVVGGCYGITVENIEINNAGNNGISVTKGGSDINISGVKIKNSSNNGIYLGGSELNKLSNVKVTNCTISGTKSNDGICLHEDGNGNSAGTNFIIMNNYAENCAEQGYDITTGDFVWLDNNISKNNGQGGILIGHSAKKIFVSNHKSYDEPTQNTSAAINISGDYCDVNITKSLIQGNGYHLLRVTTDNVKIYNNTFIWDGGSEIIDFSDVLNNIEFFNNVISTKQDTIGRMRFLNGFKYNESTIFKNNIYYAPSVMNILYNEKNYSLSEIQNQFNQETNSLFVNPSFEDKVNGNYELKFNSPCIDKGIFITDVRSQESSNTIVVNNSKYFTDGFGLVDGQQLQFSDTNNISIISNIDYLNHKIIMNGTLSIKGNSKISFSYYGISPDIGAFERKIIAPPDNLRIMNN